MDTPDISNPLQSAGKSSSTSHLGSVVGERELYDPDVRPVTDNVVKLDNYSKLKRKQYYGKENEGTTSKQLRTHGVEVLSKEKTGIQAQCNAKTEYRIEYLKKTGDVFLQNGPCSKVAPRLPKCQECMWAANESTSKILCRFEDFRRLRYTKTGNVAMAGFLDPHRDATPEDLSLWLPRPLSPLVQDMETSLFLLEHVGSQFLQLLEQEREARNMAEIKTAAWKRVVQGVREMCDVCKTALFNFHWVCRKCGFVVCIDCYKSRKKGLSKKWLLCTNGRGHSQDNLMLTQIIPGDCLETLGRKLHQVQTLCSSSLTCHFSATHCKETSSSCNVEEGDIRSDSAMEELLESTRSCSTPANILSSRLEKQEKSPLDFFTEFKMVVQSGNMCSMKSKQEVHKESHKEDENMVGLALPKLLMENSKSGFVRNLDTLQQPGRGYDDNQVMGGIESWQQESSKDYRVIDKFEISRGINKEIIDEKEQLKQGVKNPYGDQITEKLVYSELLNESLEKTEIKEAVENPQNTVHYSNNCQIINWYTLQPCNDSFETEQMEIDFFQNCVDFDWNNIMNNVNSLPRMKSIRSKWIKMGTLPITVGNSLPSINKDSDYYRWNNNREILQIGGYSIESKTKGDKTTTSPIPLLEICNKWLIPEEDTLKSPVDHFYDIRNNGIESSQVVEYIDGIQVTNNGTVSQSIKYIQNEKIEDNKDTFAQALDYSFETARAEKVLNLQQVMDSSDNYQLRDKIGIFQGGTSFCSNSHSDLTIKPQLGEEITVKNSVKKHLTSQPIEEDDNNNRVVCKNSQMAVEFFDDGLSVLRNDMECSDTNKVPSLPMSPSDNNKGAPLVENTLTAEMRNTWRVLQDSCQMTPTKSKLLFPDIPHSWLCGGRLLHLCEPDNPGNIKLFQVQWRQGQPVLVSNLADHLDKDLWHPDSFVRDFGNTKNVLVDCMTGQSVYGHFMREFWEGFKHPSKRLKDTDGNPMLLKLKDWPPGDDFAEMLPTRYTNLMGVLPMREYTRRSGCLNLVSCLPNSFVPPDLGPKMYSAYGSVLHPSKGSTNLHLDVSDAVNVLVYVGESNDSKEHDQVYRLIDEVCSDRQKLRVRMKTKIPGALWHIYAASDAAKIRSFLGQVAAEHERTMQPHQDPIHDQNWYLDSELRGRLLAEYGVEGYTIVQCLGDAIFIPAGAPHQVQNLNNCIKVAEDFVSPENISHCFRLMQEFRELSDVHLNHEDKLQIKNIIYHVLKDALSALPLE